MFLPPGFDKAIALEAGALVNLAYEQFAHTAAQPAWTLPSAYRVLGLLSAKAEGLLAKEEVFGFVAQNQKSTDVFVVFRGTKTLEDWLSDFGFPQVSHPWGHVERGFSLIYDQCSASVKNAVKSAGPGVRVFVTGHSLGGGLAVLGAADLVSFEAQMYSFAGPRVGDLAFASQFAKSVSVAWRIVNTEDIVTTVPLATPQLMVNSLPLAEGLAAGKFGLLLKSLPALNYSHIGSPVAFTTHTGSIEGNHGMLQYLAALSAA